MPGFSIPAIMLRRMDLGDYDILVTFFTTDRGKVSAVAKYAKKSVKRFAGVLELFSVLQVVYKSGRGKGLPVLQEAALIQPFYKIRYDIQKTAYASYWSELINNWMEEGQENRELFRLLRHVLGELDRGIVGDSELSILFQTRFITLSGFAPNLSHCSICRVAADKTPNGKIAFDLVQGGLVCKKCANRTARYTWLSKGTVKQLLWLQNGDLKKAVRIRLTGQAIREGLKLLEEFVPYHLGRVPKSLKVLRQIRPDYT
ncbi:MAG: DNA repair protein RecO [Desulfobacteraceae bacterium 4572_123]|nr:MAG: DNA repair protein RecO [Desulfobacteraceae bacterium 4572_123]